MSDANKDFLAGPDKVLRCAFCGHEYPEGTPTHKHEALVAHIRVCEAHPIGIENRRLREENDRLQRAYVRPDDLRAQLEEAQAEIAKLREVRAAVLAYQQITDTEYALAEWPDDKNNYRPEFVRLLRALHGTMP